MHITPVSSTNTTRHEFTVSLMGRQYTVVVYMNDKDKFIDDEIKLDGRELAYQGLEGEIREAILQTLDAHWDSLQLR